MGGGRDDSTSVTRRAGCAPADARMAGYCNLRRRRVSGAVTSTEIADDGLHAACIVAGHEAACKVAGMHEHSNTHITNKHTNTH
jgi:hypothetical protein